jgi:pimeloyl-ACP methyl ester carboxylesterase
MYCLEIGPQDAPTLLFLHGGGLSGRQWQPQVEALKDFHCLVPDLPGQGRSDEDSGMPLPTLLAELSDWIATHALDGRAHVVGLSLGGAIALSLVRAYPECIASTIVSGCTVQMNPILAAITRWSSGWYRWLPQDWLVELSIKQFGIPEQFVGLVRDDLHQALNPSVNQWMIDVLRESRAPEHGNRVLVVCGTRETIAAKQSTRQLTAQMTGARGVWAEDVGHVWNLEQPERFTEMIRAWVVGARLPDGFTPLE